MLAAANRLRTRTDFSDVVRRGRRASRPLLTVHLLLAASGSEPLPPRAGLVVSKAVGGSVVRHQVARRLRHVLRAALSALPPGARLVVRAAPAAATADSAALARDLATALDRLVHR
ncbi:MAG: ribonuclease protein component [Actinomycetota bacterium]|nr:ribonuclease protein component [Actinomycetota bacterium]